MHLFKKLKCILGLFFYCNVCVATCLNAEGLEFKKIAQTDFLVAKDEKNIDSPLESIQVCGKSLMHILGTEVDWKKDVMGEAFIFNNPMAKSSCGCGTSFTSK